MSNSTVNTPDRILEASLMLFNQRGFQSVPALKIANHLGISSGHLAYHFKSKNDIVMAVFARLEEEMRRNVLEAFAPGRPFTAADGAQHTVAVFRTLWRYRFFFEALKHLLNEDSDLRGRYLQLQEGVIGASEKVFCELIAQKFMRPITPPSTPRTLARSWWMMWLGWLNMEQIEHPLVKEAPAEAVFDGALQSHGMIQAYFSPAFSEAFLFEVRQALQEQNQSSSPPATARGKRKRRTPTRGRQISKSDE